MSAAMSRVLKLQQAGRQVDVPVKIFWPIESQSAWDCRWEIQWPDRRRGNLAGGVDAIQALTHAQQMVGAELYSSEEHRSGHLSWRDDWSGTGFSVPPGLRSILVGDDAKRL